MLNQELLQKMFNLDFSGGEELSVFRLWPKNEKTGKVAYKGLLLLFV